MKKSSIGVALALGCVLSVTAALPAAADTTTTHDVQGAEFVDVGAGVLSNYPYEPIVPAGPATFPVPFATGTGFEGSGITVPAPAEGCTRVVNSATIGFTIDTSAQTNVQALISVGVPTQYVPGTTLSYTGSGAATIGANGLADVFVPVSPSGSSGLLTLTPPAPIPSGAILSFFGAFGGTSGAITEASFAVTDTCPDVVVAAVPAPVLPNMGLSSAPLLGVAVLALLSGAAVIAASRRRAVR